MLRPLASMLTLMALWMVLFGPYAAADRITLSDDRALASAASRVGTPAWSSGIPVSATLGRPALLAPSASIGSFTAPGLLPTLGSLGSIGPLGPGGLPALIGAFAPPGALDTAFALPGALETGFASGPMFPALDGDPCCACFDPALGLLLVIPLLFLISWGDGGGTPSDVGGAFFPPPDPMPNPAPVPEPGTGLLVGAALLIGLFLRRRGGADSRRSAPRPALRPAPRSD